MEKQILDNIKTLFKCIKGSKLEAYVGLSRVRELEGKNPDDCMYVRMAKSQFFEEEYTRFRELVEELHDSMEEHGRTGQ